MGGGNCLLWPLCYNVYILFGLRRHSVYRNESFRSLRYHTCAIYLPSTIFAQSPSGQPSSPTLFFPTCTIFPCGFEGPFTPGAAFAIFVGAGFIPSTLRTKPLTASPVSHDIKHQAPTLSFGIVERYATADPSICWMYIPSCCAMIGEAFPQSGSPMQLTSEAKMGLAKEKTVARVTRAEVVKRTVRESSWELLFVLGE